MKERKARRDSNFKWLNRMEEPNQQEQEDAERECPEIAAPRNFQTKFIQHLNHLSDKLQDLRIKVEGKKADEQSSMRRSSDAQSERSTDSASGRRRNLKKSGRRANNSSINSKLLLIEGSSLNGEVHGLATVKLSNGATFQGQVNQGQLVSGRMTFQNGCEFTGDFKDSKFHGKGVLKFASGKVYEANWVEGKIDKQGIIRYPNGDVYEGELLDMKKQGQGKLTMQDGHVYEGEFRHGEINGFGTYSKGEVMIAKGYWRKGKFMPKQLESDDASSTSYHESSRM